MEKSIVHLSKKDRNKLLQIAVKANLATPSFGDLPDVKPLFGAVKELAKLDTDTGN